MTINNVQYNKRLTLLNKPNIRKIYIYIYITNFIKNIYIHNAGQSYDRPKLHVVLHHHIFVLKILKV
jgi:hypothetical protein